MLESIFLILIFNSTSSNSDIPGYVGTSVSIKSKYKGLIFELNFAKFQVKTTGLKIWIKNSAIWYIYVKIQKYIMLFSSTDP